MTSEVEHRATFVTACLFGIFACGVVITNMDQFFCFMQKKALIMWRMQMLANYVDLHHHIQSDALTYGHFQLGYEPNWLQLTISMPFFQLAWCLTTLIFSQASTEIKISRK